MAGWTTSTPDATGFHPELQRRLDATMASGRLGGMHAVAVCRGGWWRRATGTARTKRSATLGLVHFTPDTLHDLRSVTKSVVSLLYGIALERGLVPSLDTPIVDGFPEYADLVADHDRRAITVGHALSMTMGIAWDESLPYSDPRNSEIAMEHAADRYRFALGQPIVEAPGQHWIYSGGAVALIGALIARGTTMDLVEFAQEALFAPLGIAAFGWWRGKDGIPAAASGLRLTTRDLLRIGQVLLDRGMHEGRQVIPKSWIETSFQPVVDAWPGTGYGRLWYGNDAKVPALDRSLRTVFGSGYGGQRLYLLPELDLAAVTFSGDYGKPEFWVGTDRAWQEVILGAVAR